MSKLAAERLTLLALILALAVVIARGTMLEAIRQAGGAGPDPQSSPAGPGAPAALAMDLLASLPALLVLAARVIRPTESSKSSAACLFAFLLGAWAMTSALWADDKFGAVIQSAHLLAAFALLWAVSQCVTTPKRLRLVAAAAFGFLLLQITQAIQWRFVEMPQTLQYFHDHKDAILAAHGWKPTDFLARQYETKLTSREMLGFTSSANSFAAVLVLLIAVTSGLAIQKWIDRRRFSSIILAIGIALGLWILCYTQSKAAFVTPLLIAIILLLTWRFRDALRARPQKAYWSALAFFLAAVAAVIAYGLRTHSLPGASLNFRWRYWTAAWQMFLHHPVIGVGWNNFGPHYLRYRLPVAAEEILDPHNIFLRVLTETGLIGATLAVAWIARLAWELTQSPQARASMADYADISVIAIAVFIGFILNILAGVDLQQSGDYIFTQISYRVGWFGLLLIGAWIASTRLDERAAPWVLFATLAALAAFMIHNLIEFSFFEPGIMFLFAFLAGSALGMRRQKAATTRRSAAAWLIGASLLWCAAAMLLVLPVTRAEAFCAQGDDDMRAGRLVLAQEDYVQATRWCGYNSDYPYRAALAEAYRPNSDPAAVSDYLQQAIHADPSAVRYYLTRANLESHLGEKDAVRSDFDTALALDPNEVSLRLQYADALMQLGLPAEAAAECELAEKYNDLLPKEEPKRIDDAIIQSRLSAALRRETTTRP